MAATLAWARPGGESGIRGFCYNAGMNNRLVDQLATLVQDVLPGLGQDAEKVLRARLEALFARLDLVTREEFDVQKAVLQRTREQVDRLERAIALLERERRP